MLLEIQQAKDDYVRAKAGLMSFSIGFDTIQAEQDKATKARKIFEIRLWEVSLVTFPANESAVVTDVKARTFAQVAADAAMADDLHKRYWRMSDAIWVSFFELMTDEGLDDSAKLVAASASLDEFKQAMLGWFSDAMAGEFFTKSGPGPDELKAGARHSKSTLETLEAAKASAEKAVEHLSALLTKAEPDEADPDADGETKSAPTPGTAGEARPDGAPDAKTLADVARLADEITAAAVETKALNAIRDLQRTMSAPEAGR
jgi:hypothetical protein